MTFGAPSCGPVEHIRLEVDSGALFGGLIAFAAPVVADFRPAAASIGR